MAQPLFDFDLKRVSHQHYITGNRAKDFITKGLEGGALQPIISKTFPLSEMIEAHQYMESNAQIGKIVIEL